MKKPRQFNLAEATDKERKKLAQAYDEFLSCGMHKKPVIVSKNININGDVFFTCEPLTVNEDANNNEACSTHS